jgi:UDP-glucose 4-epimerase
LRASLKGAEVLVTGGSGFIGTYLCELLAEESVKVFNLDSRAPILTETAIHVNGNTTDSDNLRDLVKTKSAIFHLAGHANIKESIDDPIKDAILNINGTLEVLEAIRKYSDDTNLLLVSTSAVYGETRPRMKSESSPVNPINPYAASKAAAEIYANMYYRKYGLKVVVVRLFNTYGAFELRGRDVVTQFVKSVLEGKPPQVAGDGAQIRDLTYVRDTVTAMRTLVTTAAAFGKVFNIGTGHGVKVSRLAELVIEIFGNDRRMKPNFNLVSDPGSPGNICNTELLQSTIGAAPTTTIRRGLIEMRQMNLTPRK